MMATCGFTRPRSFTEDNAFHQFIVTRYGRGGGVAAALVQAYFLAEAWVSESAWAYALPWESLWPLVWLSE